MSVLLIILVAPEQILSRNNLHIMRADNMKRYNNKPMKSPSPDIANKSIIKDTKMPIDDINRYLEKSVGNRSPKASNMASARVSGMNQASFETLMQRIRLLETRNKELQEQNTSLKKRINHLELNPKNQLTEFPKVSEIVHSQYTSRDLSPKNSSGDEKLQQIQERLMKFVTENGRLGTLIFEKDNLIKKLNEDNDDLRRHIDSMNSKYQPNKGASLEEEQKLRYIYENQIIPEMKRNQLAWINQIKQLNEKISKLEVQQQYLIDQLENRERRQTPNKSGYDRERTVGTERKQMKSTPEYLVESSGERGRTTDREYNILIENLKKQIQFYRKKCYALEFQIKQLKQKKPGISQFTNFDLPSNAAYQNNDGNKSPLSRSAISQRSKDRSNAQNLLNDKIQELESELEKKILKISNLEKELEYNKNLAKQKYEREMSILEKEKNKIKQNLDDERERNAELNEKLENMEEELGQSRTLLIDKESRKNNLEEFYQEKIEKMMREHEGKLELATKDMEAQLARYLELIKQIKKDIEGSDVQFNFGEDGQDLQPHQMVSKMTRAHQQNLKLLQTLKVELLTKQKLILQLQKQLYLKQQQVNQLQQQKTKLQQMMLNDDKLTRQLAEGMNIHKEQQNCKMKLCLKQTIKKINLIESEISHLLTE